jgi:hypothetical protein
MRGFQASLYPLPTGVVSGIQPMHSFLHPQKHDLSRVIIMQERNADESRTVVLMRCH